MPSTPYQAINPHVLLDAVGGDIPSFCQLSQTFLRTAPPMVERLEQAMRNGDGGNAMLESHSLKSTAALVGATRLTRMIEELEKCYGEDAREAAIALLPTLNEEFCKVAREVGASIRAAENPSYPQA